MVLLIDDLVDLCRSYIRVKDNYSLESEYLFPDINGKARDKQWLGYQFRKCWKIAGVEFQQQPQPRVDV